MAQSGINDLPSMTSVLSPTMREIVSQKDAERVKAAIIVKYGFVPTDEYCRDLIAFVKELTSEPRK